MAGGGHRQDLEEKDQLREKREINDACYSLIGHLICIQVDV